MSLLSSFLRKIKLCYYSSTYERKIEYLRSIGVTIGDRSRVMCDLSLLANVNTNH